MGARPAVSSDAPLLAEVLEEAASGLATRRGGEALLTAWLASGEPSGAHERTAAMLAVHAHAVFVDEQGRGVSIAWVNEGVGWAACYVRVDARRLGAGPELMASALGWLDGRCEDIDAFALPGDRDWKSLLEKSGFKARLLTLRRDA